MLSLSADLIWKRLLIVCPLSILTFFHIFEALIFKWIEEYLGFISQVLLQWAVARLCFHQWDVHRNTEWWLPGDLVLFPHLLLQALPFLLVRMWEMAGTQAALLVHEVENSYWGYPRNISSGALDSDSFMNWTVYLWIPFIWERNIFSSWLSYCGFSVTVELNLNYTYYK